jgi:programmed cell death protein 5
VDITPEQLQEIQKIEELKKIVMKKILTKEALERMNRIRLVKPDLATQLELYLLQLYQAGQIKAIIDDERLKMVLDSIVKKKDFKILR